MSEKTCATCMYKHTNVKYNRWDCRFHGVPTLLECCCDNWDSQYLHSLKHDIVEVWTFLRANNSTIPSESLDFIKDTCIEKITEMRDKAREGGCD